MHSAVARGASVRHHPGPQQQLLGGRCPGAHARGSAARGHGHARARVIACAARQPNYYELLGVDPSCSDDDIKAAYRRRAKELHPDVNKEEGAHESFVEVSRAYEVLGDPDKRRRYNVEHRIGLRRANFFQDVEEDDEDGMPRMAPFRWAHTRGAEDSRAWGMRPGDDEEEAAGGHSEQDEGEAGGAEEDEEAGKDPDESDFDRAARQARFMEDLARYMSGGGSLSGLQGGRYDPFGNSTTDTWFRQVERQTRGMPGTSGDEDAGLGGRGRDWEPPGRTPGWTPPGRGSEWSHPRRQWDEEDRSSGRPGRGGGGGGGGGGDFRRPFKI